MKPRRLTRADGRPAAPVRSVHLGLGNFFKAHQASYAEHAADAERWGIAAFTGRRPDAAEVLRAQDEVYTLVQRGADGDQAEVISSISSVHASDDLQAWLGVLCSPELSFVTMTITEVAYQAEASGALGRLTQGLQARREAGAGPLAIVPCDNLPENGDATRRMVLNLAAETPGLASWIDDHVSFVNTLVNRITPRPTPDDLADYVAKSGIDDPALVLTEPSSEWVLAGEFPAGHPDWQSVRRVDDIGPWQQRKLWLLNGAHTLMAAAGPRLGHTTVAEAIGDPRIRGWVDAWWRECLQHLELPREQLEPYRDDLIERFANPALQHRLDQINTDVPTKLQVRIVPVLRAELAAGREPHGALIALAAWVAHQRDQLDRRESPTPQDVATMLSRLGLDGDQSRSAARLVLDHLDAVQP